MNCTYEVKRSFKESDSGQLIAVYGIEAVNKQSGAVEKSVLDVSSNRSEIQCLVSACNDGQLDPIHLDDIIEDFLNS